jgi:hypothetical protein
MLPTLGGRWMAVDALIRMSGCFNPLFALDDHGKLQDARRRFPTVVRPCPEMGLATSVSRIGCRDL